MMWWCVWVGDGMRQGRIECQTTSPMTYLSVGNTPNASFVTLPSSTAASELPWAERRIGAPACDKLFVLLYCSVRTLSQRGM
jgi:hypothetical protein